MTTLIMMATLLLGQVQLTKDSLTMGEFKQLLAQEGYSIAKQANDYNFDITRKGASAPRRLFVSYSEDAKVELDQRHPVCIELKSEYGTQKFLDVNAPYVLADASKTTIVKTTIQQHIDGWYSAVSQILKPETRSRLEIVLALEVAWTGVDKHAKSLAAQFTAFRTSQMTLDSSLDSIYVRYPDHWSLAILVHYWNWDYKGNSGGSSPGWCIATSFDGYNGWILQGSKPDALGSSSVGIRLTITGISKEKCIWVNEHPTNYKWARIEGYGDSGTVKCATGLKITPTTKVKDLRNQIQTLIDHAKELEKELKN